MQVGEALGPLGQTVLQPPQLFTVLSGVSHPLAALLSQLPKPADSRRGTLLQRSNQPFCV